jgi:hypothetical protein
MQDVARRYCYFKVSQKTYSATARQAGCRHSGHVYSEDLYVVERKQTVLQVLQHGKFPTGVSHSGVHIAVFTLSAMHLQAEVNLSHGHRWLLIGLIRRGIVLVRAITSSPSRSHDAHGAISSACAEHGQYSLEAAFTQLAFEDEPEGPSPSCLPRTYTIYFLLIVQPTCGFGGDVSTLSLSHVLGVAGYCATLFRVSYIWYT